MIAGESVPAGFRIVRDRGPSMLIADERHADELLQLGLGTRRGWDDRLGGAGPGAAGRGPTGRCRLATGSRLRLKQLRRGGLTASLWRDRFHGTRRLLRNLSVPLEALRRGVATPAPVGLLVERAGAGLVRGWIAFEELEGTEDLLTACRSTGPPRRAELGRVLDLVRGMHDRGVEHRDLNLGNLLLRRREPPRAYVIDLDRARLHAGSLGFRARQRALRRLERSHVKAGLAPHLVDDYYALYAANDGALAARLARGRPAGRLWIRLHRLAWPKGVKS